MKQDHIFMVHSPQSKRVFYGASQNLYRIWLLRSANGSIAIDNENFILKDHSIVVAYPGQHIVITSIGPFVGYGIAFDEAFFYQQTEHRELLFRSPFFGYPLDRQAVRITPKQFSGFDEVAALMLQEYRRREAYCGQVLLSLLNVILMRLKRFKWAQNQLVHQNDYTTLQLVMKFKQLIRLNCQKHHSVSWYAEHLQQSANYLNVMVKRVTGKTAGDIIAAQIIMEAKRQLIHTKLSPKEVAFALGFSDHSYFTKFFRKHTGKSPLQWFNDNKRQLPFLN